MSHQRIQEAAKAVDEDCPLPWEVHGDSPEKPPMIWDAKGDAIVCQMPDGRPYFEAEVAALIVAAVNSITKHIPEQNEPLRCLITTNECGSDTWMVGCPCKCENCTE